jgi:UDP-GlcNAc3NAcA epimerase
MKLLSIVGARPQFIKAAVVSRALRQAGRITEVMVHTGQHFDSDMSDVFFAELEIPAPAHHLDIHGGGHGDMTGRMLGALEAVAQAEAPDMVLVYGDTNSTLAGALAAAKLHIPVAHVEAGLRSFNRRMPEEINRVLTDHLSELLFCPTRTAVENLRREGITRNVANVGDVMYDAARFAAAQAGGKSAILERLGLRQGGYGVATIHRAENTDSAERLRRVLDYLRRQAGALPIVLPLHPRTRQAAQRFGIALDGLAVCPPVGYFDMARLLQGAAVVLTDSGGVQKEAYFHRVPCVTLRDETEWIETVESGWNRLWAVADYRPRREIDEYGDGRAGEAVVAALLAV